MKKKIKLSQLVEDFDFYPRNAVNGTHVGDLARAMEAGTAVPPPVIEAKGSRIVDGFHRVRAYRRVLGDDAEIVCDVRQYKSESDLFLDAVALNSSHGRKLDTHDRTRIVNRCRELAIPDQHISNVLHVPERQIQRLSLRVILNPDGEPVPNKRGGQHLEGKVMTLSQLEVIDKVQSLEVGRRCRELIGMLREGLYDPSDGSLIPLMVELRRQLDAVLEVRQTG